MSLGKEPFLKNLEIEKENNTKNILETGNKKKDVSGMYNDATKVLDKVNLINTQTVSTNLTENDKEYLDKIIDMDLYKEYVITFENLPTYRLAREKAILKRGPKNMKGCKKWYARYKWTKKQKKRVKNAEGLLTRHTALLKEYENYRKEKVNFVEQITQDVSQKHIDAGSNDVAGMLIDTNDNLARDMKYALNERINLTELDEKINTSLKNLETLIDNYVIDEDKSELERHENQKKDKEKRKKAEKKTGKVAADEEIIEAQEEAENIIFDKVEDNKFEIQTKVMNLDGQNATKLSDMTALFKKVLLETKFKNVTANKDGKEKAAEKIGDEDLSTQRYVGIKADAKKLVNYAKDLNIRMPEELYYLVEIGDNPLMATAMEKFEPDKHGQEAYVLLLSATAQIYYGALNRFAGYYVTDGLQNYQFSKDLERTARNFDIFNVEMMTQVRNIKDMTEAYAGAIRQNIEKIYTETVPEGEIQDKNRRENAKIMEGAQPTGLKEEEKKKVNTEEDQEKIYEEWKNLIMNDIRGTTAVQKKGTKQEKWILKDYADQVMQIMKDTPSCRNLKGTPLKKYLISINSYLNKALLQLEDELPKSSVGEKFKYVPKLRDEFIEKVKRDRFALLLRPFFYRDLLRNNSILDDLFDGPKYKAVENRQREIMKAINEKLGLEFYTNALHLSSLWANKEIQKLLLSEPEDQKEQEKLAEEEIKKNSDKEKDQNLTATLAYRVKKLLSKSDNYGVTDQKFKDAIEKIKANVQDNIAVIDRKMKLMGLCDTAKEMLKKSVFKSLGGEYLLGYNVVSQDIVEYTIDNLMAYDGNAAEIQRTWDRKFARTGLPGRLSQKLERVVAAQINAEGKKDAYYLRPQGFKVSKAEKEKWKATNNKTNAIINSLKTLYNNHMKDLLAKMTDQEEARKFLKNHDSTFINGQLKLSKQQWDDMENYLESLWLKEYKDVYTKGKYDAAAINKKLPDIKEKLYAGINKYLTDNYSKRQKLEKDIAAKQDFEDTLVTRQEYSVGLKNNVVIEQPKTVVTEDIKNQIFGDEDLKTFFKKAEDQELFKKLLEDLLADEKSPLHARYPYLDDVRSIEQISDLDLVDYTQFFADLKANLKATGAAVTAQEKDQYIKAKIEARSNKLAKNKNKQQTEETKKYENLKKERNKDDKKDRLLIEEWRKSGIGGGDIFGIKKLLLRDFIAGEITNENIVGKVADYEEDALMTETVERMRIDAILASDKDMSGAYIKFNYLNVVGKDVKQTDRMKHLYGAEQIWNKIHQGDMEKDKTGKNFQREEKLSIFLSSILKNLEGLPAKELTKKINKLGEFLDKLELVNVGTAQEPKWDLDDKSKKLALSESAGIFRNYVFFREDVEMLGKLKVYLAEINKADPSSNKLKFSDFAKEMFLFGCGKQYFDAGGEGEKVFLNSDNSKYLKDVVDKGIQFYKNRELVQKALADCDLSKAQIDVILGRLKTVIAGVVETYDPELMAKNRAKYGVTNLADLINKLQGMYDKKNNPDALQNLAKSQELGQLYIQRRNYIDSYPAGSESQGKFRIIRDYMLKDEETWKIIMTASDNDFKAFMDKQNEIYGTFLDVLMSDKYRASQPIMEQYIMMYWPALAERSSWSRDEWDKDIDSFNTAFFKKKVGDKSVNNVLDNVQKQMVKEGLDPSVKQGTILLRLSYILEGDPAAFALLYSEKDMLDAIKRFDVQYKENINFFTDTMSRITLAKQDGEKYVDDPELDALYKEIAAIVDRGRIIENTRGVMSFKSVQALMEEKKKQNNGKPDADSKIYADYALLMQIMRHAAYTSSKDAFKAKLFEKLKEFKEAREDIRNADIYGDENIIKTKDKVRLDIEIKKNQGKMLEREYLGELNEYREKRASLGSIGLVAYNANPKFDAKDIAKLRKFVETNLGGNYEQADESFIRGLLTERAIAFGEIKEEDLKDRLEAEKMRLLSLDKAIRQSDPKITEDEIKKAIVFAFAQNADRTDHLLDGTHEGDVKAIMDELKERAEMLNIKRPASAIAQRDYDEFMEEIDIARYTMKLPQFKEICRKKQRYFDFIDVAFEKIKAANPELKIQIGLYEYFKKDVFEAISSDTKSEDFAAYLQDEIDKLIGDKAEGKYDLDAKSIKQMVISYLPDSSLTLQQVSNLTATTQEKLFTSTNYTRADVQKELALAADKNMVKLYNNLTVEEQKVFAIALTFPDIGLTETEQLASNEALKDKEKDLAKELELQEQLARFIYDKDFMPKIDYNVVMRRLIKTDRKTGLRRVSKTMFEKALKYTMFCVTKKNELKPKDFNKLSDGRLTGTLGRLFATGKEKEDESFELPENQQIEKDLAKKTYYGAQTFKKFFTKYADSDIQQDKSVKKIFDRFKELNNTQMYMLLHVLQDRTAVDFTTTDTKLKALMLQGVGHVNEERREAIKYSFMRPDGMDHNFIKELNRSMTHSMYDKAAETLFSYQLRDDVDLSSKSITKEDFAKGALERKTKVDWTLLRRAMDFVEEIENDNIHIQLCRQSAEHTTDNASINEKARALGKEIDEAFREKTTNHMDFFNDMLVREAKKNPDTAMPLISAFSGLSMNEKMLLIHSLKHRDILDVSSDGAFTTAIGMNENKYVNEVGRDNLADYYIEHFGVAGAENIMATSQYDVRSAMKSLVSTKVSDSRDPATKKTYQDLLEGKTLMNWVHIGSRSTGIDWELFANALKFVKRTEEERQLLVGHAERYRSAGDIDKYGRYRYNFQYMRKIQYRSGIRFTRFLGRRVKAEIEQAIPLYGVGTRIMMACLGPEMRNKILNSGVIKPGESKNAVTDILGYAGIGGSIVGGVGSALKMLTDATGVVGTAIGGEVLTQVSSALSGIYNIGNNINNIKNADKPLENEEELRKQSDKKAAEANYYQTEVQQLISKSDRERSQWILDKVGGGAAVDANRQQLVETLTECVNVLAGSSVGVKYLFGYLGAGIKIAVQEALNTANFIISVCQDKKMMDRYFDSEGPLGKEIQDLRSKNIQLIKDDQSLRRKTGTRAIMDDADFNDKDVESFKKMSNVELFRKAYGFKDFSEQASYVGWNIVQTLLSSASPFGSSDPLQFMKASMLLTALGCKDAIGKQDNETAQIVYNRLMGKNVR